MEAQVVVGGLLDGPGGGTVSQDSGREVLGSSSSSPHSRAGLSLAPPPPTSSLQIELLGSDMLQLLPQHTEGGPRRRVQGPALLHQVVYGGRAAVWSIHLVSPLHPRHHLFQRLTETKRETETAVLLHKQLLWVKGQQTLPLLPVFQPSSMCNLSEEHVELLLPAMPEWAF